jgi:uncharacterized protein DUF6089
MKKPIAGILSLLVPIVLFISTQVKSQEQDRSWMFGVFAGAVNYQGDLKPTSFTFNHSNPAFSFSVRKPLGKWLSFKAGMAMAKIEGADEYNRDYLKTRNLSFYSDIKEITAGLEINMLDITTKKFSPYLYGGISVFRFNPWTYDENGVKVYLQPLGTEGQGLAEYPKRKVYKLTQPALAFGIGARYAVGDNLNLGIEFSQRKSFTDYIDDVSTSYADYDVLLNARGMKAVEIAFRGDELQGGGSYPHDGEQRGTPSEMDWYYYFGITIEVKLSSLGSIFKFRNENSSVLSSTKCPRFY